MFEVTASLRDILSFIQDTIPAEVFQKLCSKVSVIYPAQSISREDIVRLSDKLSCDVDKCQRSVDTIYFLFSKISYNTTKPSTVRTFLTPLLGAPHAGIVADSWETSAADITARLKRTISSNKTFTWGSSVSVSRSDCARLSETEATLQVQVDGKFRNIAFDYESLARFYNELERIQSAIDQLA